MKARGKETLEQFARRIATFLQTGPIERRESSSFVDGEYYKGEALALVVKFAWSDEVDLAGYEFWIHIKSPDASIEHPEFVDGLADLIARRLTLAGEQVVRIVNAEGLDRRQVFYADGQIVKE